MHVCPKPLPPPATTVHGPGMIQAAGASKVFVNKMAAAVTGDICNCVQEPGTNKIQAGSSTVYFGSKQAARQLDLTTHFPGGNITMGSADVYIGG